jgi:hypothetical protein
MINIKLRNKVWKLVKQDLGLKVRGEIDPPSYTNKKIKLSSNLKKSNEILEVFIHECLHGCFWYLDETTVDKAAYDIARALYKLGARISIDKVPKNGKFAIFKNGKNKT